MRPRFFESAETPDAHTFDWLFSLGAATIRASRCTPTALRERDTFDKMKAGCLAPAGTFILFAWFTCADQSVGQEGIWYAEPFR
jgi:hypothetical protein